MFFSAKSQVDQKFQILEFIGSIKHSRTSSLYMKKKADDFNAECLCIEHYPKPKKKKKNFVKSLIDQIFAELKSKSNGIHRECKREIGWDVVKKTSRFILFVLGRKKIQLFFCVFFPKTESIKSQRMNELSLTLVLYGPSLWISWITVFTVCSLCANGVLVVRKEKKREEEFLNPNEQL